ncbi:MAG: Mur ligase family protein [Patescibacteria group bacterium]
MMLENLKNKKILILGFGREGKDSFLFLRKLFPNKTLGVADRLKIKDLRFKKTDLHLGEKYLEAIKNYDVIIKSPGIPLKIIKPSIKRGQKITSQTEIFFDNCPGIIIGITGTKGKSTTTSMIYKILKAGGFRAHLVGNIGKPVLSHLLTSTPKDIYVYELSSHQLRGLKKSPHIGVFLNIYSEHLDYYKNMEEYVAAKSNIALWQTKDDYLIYNSGDKKVNTIVKKSKSQKIPIRGEYYGLDKNAAREVGKIFEIPPKIIEKTIKEFKYLPHRLEKVGTFKGITFYNDALATIPEATMAALKSLGRKVQTLMLGGFERNIDFSNLAKAVLRHKIKTVILFPTTGERIWKSIRQAQDKARKKHLVASHIEPFFTNNMKDAVKIAYQNTGKGKICLLSTASSSFSIFKDYKEKGNLFKKFVKSYGKQRK